MDQQPPPPPGVYDEVIETTENPIFDAAMEKKRGNKPSDESSEDSLSSSDSSSDEEEVRGFGSFGRRLLIAGTIWKMQEFLRWYYFTSTRLSVDLVPCVKMLTLDETNPFVFHYLLKSGIPPQHIPTRFPRGRVAPRCPAQGLFLGSLASVQPGDCF